MNKLLGVWTIAAVTSNRCVESSADAGTTHWREIKLVRDFVRVMRLCSSAVGGIPVAVLGAPANCGAMRLFHPVVLSGVVNLLSLIIPDSLVRGVTWRPLSPSARPVS